MKRLIVVAGPTAVGKTAMAIRLAQHLGTEIISCDSRQFYSELNIGVARPSDEELQSATHHFIANRNVTEPYNVYSYEQEAMALLNKLFLSHDDVIAVGGSGLYINALCHGINLMPDPSPQLRATLSDQIRNGQLPQLLEQLKQLDPDYYRIVDHNNPIRIQRALEVTLTAHRPYSELIAAPLPPRPFKVAKIALTCDGSELRQRISQRTDEMVRQGLYDEVQSLLPYRTLNTLNTVGYKEIFPVIDNQTSLPDAILQIKNHTWQYAKKQITWLKRDESTIWNSAKNFESILQVLKTNTY